MQNTIIKREIFKKALRQEIRDLFRTTLEEATPRQIYQAVCYVVKDQIIDNWMKTQKAMKEQDPKIVYYMSMEFLTGRYLGNNLLALTAYKEVKEALEELGIDLNAVEDQERDPALGNGGLGRLAACFLDSLSTLGYAAYGCGIRYYYGMFKQRIENGMQVEEPDRWLLDGGYPFELKRPEYAKEIRFGGDIEVDYDEKTGRNHFRQVNYRAVRAVPYDLPVVGYGNGVVNTLRIWDAEAIEDF
ncbi:MAG: glycogen/starch/alpha-glucan phosphorylase, partial [Eubacterium sp.]|nr:glycogen/starch/alpha-glucan phosphorylase [Eubacterium sp.]